MSATRDIKVSIAPRDIPLTSYVGHRGKVHPSCLIGPNVYIAPNVTIGKDCVIGPGAVIGSDGFGYEQIGDESGSRWERKPQSHGVVIEPDVHIGANTCIARGSYRDTVIGEGTRIDNLVHIAHNVQVGKRCMIVAHAELSGSVEVGDGAWIGPSACVREHLSIGAGALVGIGAVVVKDVPPNETWAGNPAVRLGR